MAIKVQCTDGMAELGGEFQEALKQIKSIEGRKFDGSTKTWSVPLTVAEFRAKTHGPLDTPTGHVTRYGNFYTRNEWESKKAADRGAQTAAAQIDEEQAPQRAALESALMTKLAELNSDEKINKTIAGLIKHYDGLTGAEYAGKIKFSSIERRRAYLDIEEWYWQWSNELDDLRNTAIEAAKERAYGEYGE